MVHTIIINMNLSITANYPIKEFDKFFKYNK